MTAPVKIVPWLELPSLATVAGWIGVAPASLEAEARAFPDGVWGVAVTRGERVEAAGVVVEREIGAAGRLSIVRILEDGAAGEAMPLVEWGERRARALGARTLRVSLRRAPALVPALEARGYARCEAFLTLSRTEPPEPAPALPDDLEEVGLEAISGADFLAMSNAAFGETPGAFPLDEADWAAICREPGYRPDLVRVLRAQARPVGFLRGAVRPDGVGVVEAIGLLPELRGRGLGRALLRRCEALLVEHGADRRELQVAESNAAAYALYLREGWVETERRLTYDRHGV